MSTPAEPMAYIARAACGCIKMATMDTPEMRATNAKEIGNCIRDGYQVERVTASYVREHWRGGCDRCRPPRPHQQGLDL